MAVNPITWVRTQVDDDPPPVVEYPRSRAWLIPTPITLPCSFSTGLSLKTSFQSVQGDLADSRYRR